MKKLFTLATLLSKNDRNIEKAKSAICISVLFIVLLITLSSCSNDEQSSCPTVAEKRIDKNATPSKFYVTLSNGQTSGVSYAKYSSLNIGDEVCTILNYN